MSLPEPPPHKARPPLEARFGWRTLVLMAVAGLGGANLLGVVAGVGCLATTSSWANLVVGGLLATTPLFLCTLQRVQARSGRRPAAQSTLTAAALTVGSTAWLLLMLPVVILLACVLDDIEDLWASPAQRTWLAAVLVLAVVMWLLSSRQARRMRAGTAAASPPTQAHTSEADRPTTLRSRSLPWPAIAMAASGLWLLAQAGVLGVAGLRRLEPIGTDPSSGKHYDAEPLQRDRPTERHWLLERTPLLGGLLEWRRTVTVHPPLPADVTRLEFSGGTVFALQKRGLLPMIVKLR